MYVGIDLGGTNTAAALVDAGGGIIKRAAVHTDVHGGAIGVVNGLLAVCESLLVGTAEAPLSIGIGVPGMVDDETGNVIYTPNLPLSGENITLELKKKYGCTIRLGNDANCAALGETIAGGAKGAKNVVLITLGTGIGGGIVLDGRLYTGFDGAAGELGHMVICAGGRKCGCGRLGCWETYASATGLIRTTIEIIGTQSTGKLWELCGGDIGKIDGRMVFNGYRAGDQTARLAVERYINDLAAGIINIISILSPEIICVGGGISNEWDCLSEPLQAAVDAEKYTRFSPQSPQTRIVRAELVNDAGIIGAALLGLRFTDR